MVLRSDFAFAWAKVPSQGVLAVFPLSTETAPEAWHGTKANGADPATVDHSIFSQIPEESANCISIRDGKSRGVRRKGPCGKSGVIYLVT